jgi:hypothetical protein
VIPSGAVGDETVQFALRFSNAVKQLTLLAGDETHAQLQKLHRTRLTAVVRDALDAVAEVYGTGTEAVRDWPQQGRRVLGQLATMRDALDRSGVDDEVRRMARALVELIEPRAPRAR